MRFLCSLLLLLVLGARDASHDLALVGARIYPSPTEPPIENGAIVIHDGRIVTVGPRASITIPRDAEIIDCNGMIVTAGFWNSHVHILTPGLLHADRLTPQQITSQLQEMLTRWGFTTVFDIASVLANTNTIRHRIQTGEVNGPRILTVGEPFWIETPSYVQDFLQTNHLSMPGIRSPTVATRRVDQQIRDGADGIKIFANSIERDTVVTMPLELARAIVTESHRLSKPVFAHVSNDHGIDVALESGVDILAHTTPLATPWSPSNVARMIAARVALTPTLTLWDVELTKGNASRSDIDKVMSQAARQLEAFSQAGGQVLFGTDVGYIDRFDTSEEFLWMSRAGMSFRQILASLTTSPAQRFGYATRSGRIATGMDGDLVVLASDPASDATAFAKVRYTIRSGVVIYSQH